jgi:hypothetical protein
VHARRQSIEYGGARPMSPRAAAWLAWSLGGLSLAMFVAIVGQFVLARTAQVPGSWGAVGNLMIFVPFLA